MLQRRTDADELIGLIYEAAIEPEKWPELLHGLSELVVRDAQVDQSLADSAHEVSLASEDSPQLLASLSQTLEKVSVTSSETVLQGSGRELEIGYVLLEHFKRALKVAKRLLDVEEQRDAIASLMDRLPIALFIVDQNAVILEVNLQAQQLLSGTRLLLQEKSCLNSSSSRLNQRLHQAIALAASASSPEMSEALFLEGEGDEEDDLMVFITPAVRKEHTENVPVAVFISRRQGQPFSLPSSVAELYGLTERELDIAELLMQGKSVNEISELANVSVNTVRTHVKSIFAKTDTNRQVDFVRLMLCHPFLHGPESLENMGVTTGESVFMGEKNPLRDVPKFVQLKDGRKLAYQEYGDPGGKPLLFFHSILGSRVELAFDGAEYAKQHGFRLILPERPGFGFSDAAPERSYLSWADDISQLLAKLRIKQVHVCGYAMGGQYALACAHALPDIVSGVTLISAGAAISEAAELEQMVPFYRLNYRLAKNLPKVHRLLVSITRKGVLRNPDGLFELMGDKIAVKDAELMKDQRFRDHYLHSLEEGVRQSATAPAWEAVLYANDWGFELAEITQPVDVWHGACDRHVPFCLGEKLAKRLPNARLHRMPDDGHFMFYYRWPEILDAISRPPEQKA